MTADKPRVPVTHVLKCAPQHFFDVQVGLKKAELRFDDRGFQVGDILELHAWEDGKYVFEIMGACRRRITHILRSDEGPWLSPGYVMLSLGLND